MNVSKLFFIIITLASWIMVNGQDQRHKLVALETDPISTLLGAKTLSVVLEPKRPGHWSFFLNGVTANFPDWVDDVLNPNNKNKGFATKISFGGGFAVDYFLKEERKGIYVGLMNLFFDNNVRNGGLQKSILTHNVIPRLGYRWYPLNQKTLYLNPFVGIRYEYSLNGMTTIKGQKFEAAGLQPFGTIHIGIKI